MSKPTIAAATGLATLLIAGLAMANEPYFPRKEMGFNRLDVNKDGKIEKSEFNPIFARRFARMDTDGNKAVSTAELQSILEKNVEQRRVRILSLLDRNKDGAIAETEIDAVIDAMFDSADSDNDGAVSLIETQSFKRSDWRKTMLNSSPN